MAEDSSELQAIEKAIRDLMAEGMAARAQRDARPAHAGGSIAPASLPSGEALSPPPAANPPTYAQKPQRRRSTLVTAARNYDPAPVARHALKCE